MTFTYKKSKAFTMLELLVAVFIFATVVIIASSGYTTKLVNGRGRAMANKNLTQDLNRTLDIITQKMESANAKVIGSNNIRGFGIINPSTLGVAIKQGNKTDCSFISRQVDNNSRGYLAMKDNACDQSPTFDTTNRLTSSKIDVTSFELSGNFDTNDGQWIKIVINAQDITDETAKAKVQTTYNLSYDKAKNMEQ